MCTQPHCSGGGGEEGEKWRGKGGVRRGGEERKENDVSCRDIGFEKTTRMRSVCVPPVIT